MGCLDKAQSDFRTAQELLLDDARIEMSHAFYILANAGNLPAIPSIRLDLLNFLIHRRFKIEQEHSGIEYIKGYISKLEEFEGDK